MNQPRCAFRLPRSAGTAAFTHDGVAGVALKELRGFQRIHLAPGEGKAVTFTFRDRDLSVVDSDGTRRIVKGNIKAWIGGGQPFTEEAGKIASDGVNTQLGITSERVLPE